MTPEQEAVLTLEERVAWDRVKGTPSPLCDGWEYELKCALETIANLRLAQRWIPCSERMPEPSYGKLLLVDGVVAYGYRRDPTNLGPRASRWIVGGRATELVTHWQPLPAPLSVEPEVTR